MTQRRSIAIIGGTGKEGSGLALRWAAARHRVLVGSRDAARAVEKARELAAAAGAPVEGADNEAAVREAEVAVLTVPWAAHGDTLAPLRAALAGRILVDVTVPLAPPRVTRVSLPPGRAAALEAREIVGPDTRVVAALHHISFVHLRDLSHRFDTDVLVCADDRAASDVVIELCADLGLRGLDAGPLENAIAVESMTPVLLYLNKRYAIPGGAGIRITGIP
jgi:NADPH-dependent F420 reductase